jgi:peptidoglycan/xylan/chitin deacetylase (PgdA/CDA1 family)
MDQRGKSAPAWQGNDLIPSVDRFPLSGTMRHLFPMKFNSFLCLAVTALGTVSCAKKTARRESPPPAGAPAIAPANQQRRLHNAGVNLPVSSLPPGTKISYNSAPAPGPFIAMTYDDGPHPSNTPRLLDMLAARGIKATFYTVGRNVAAYPNIMRRMIAEGHEVANHTWTHPYLSRISDDAVRSELQRSHEALVRITGTAPRTYRPPYGAITARQMQWIYSEFGYPTIRWSVDPQDWRTRSASMTRSRILAETRPGSIILVHDIHPSSIDAMPGTLDGLLARGFRFVTVSQLISLHQGRGPGAAPVAAVETSSFTPGSF